MMDEKELQQGFITLNNLAKAEYHKSLEQLQTDPTSTIDPSLQVGRLIGVMMKEPFAEPQDLPFPSTFTAAYRGWNLLGRERFDDPRVKASWQYELLQQLAAAEGFGNDSYSLADVAHYERGFFGYLGRSVAGYICGDPKIRGEVEKAVDDTRKAGFNISLQSPEAAVGTGGMILGAALIQHAPILGFVGAPVIAGLVLVVYRIGVDAFCEWMQQYQVDAESAR
jgi:hypothetical protein